MARTTATISFQAVREILAIDHCKRLVPEGLAPAVLAAGYAECLAAQT